MKLVPSILQTTIMNNLTMDFFLFRSLLRAQLIPYTEQLQIVAVENNSKDDDEKLITKRKRVSGIFKYQCLIRTYLFGTTLLCWEIKMNF
jgi:hypothetical protein